MPAGTPALLNPEMVVEIDAARARKISLDGFDLARLPRRASRTTSDRRDPQTADSRGHCGSAAFRALADFQHAEARPCLRGSAEDFAGHAFARSHRRRGNQ